MTLGVLFLETKKKSPCVTACLDRTDDFWCMLQIYTLLHVADLHIVYHDLLYHLSRFGKEFFVALSLMQGYNQMALTKLLLHCKPEKVANP